MPAPSESSWSSIAYAHPAYASAVAGYPERLSSDFDDDGPPAYDPREQREHARSGPQDIKLPWFLPYFDDQQTLGENAAMRLAYRRMLADPNVKAATYGKIGAVQGYELKVVPSDRKDERASKLADLVRWNLTEAVRGGLPELVWSVFSGGLMDGYSISEKVWTRQEKGKFAGAYRLSALKPKDVGRDLVLVTDEFRNIVAVRGLRFNPGVDFPPSAFIIYRHLPLFDVPTGQSDFRACYSRYWLLDTALKLRAIGIDKRAIPLLMGTYKHAQQRPALETALSMVKSQNWLAVPEGVRVEALNIAGAADGIFASAVQQLAEDIFLGIAGATLQARQGDVNNARGSSAEHRNTADLFIKMLSQAFEANILNDQDHGLIKEICDLNAEDVQDYPKGILQASDDENLEARSKLYETFWKAGMPFSKNAINDEFGFEPPDPDDPEDALGGKADQEAQVAAATIESPRGPADVAASDRRLTDSVETGAQNASQQAGVTGPVENLPQRGQPAPEEMAEGDEPPKPPAPPATVPAPSASQLRHPEPSAPAEEPPPELHPRIQTNEYGNYVQVPFGSQTANVYEPRDANDYNQHHSRAGYDPFGDPSPERAVHLSQAPSQGDYEDRRDQIIEGRYEELRDEIEQQMLTDFHNQYGDDADEEDAWEMINDESSQAADAEAREDENYIDSEYEKEVFDALPVYYLHRDPDFTAVYAALKARPGNQGAQFAMNDWLEEHGLDRFKFYFDDDPEHPRARPFAEDDRHTRRIVRHAVTGARPDHLHPGHLRDAHALLEKYDEDAGGQYKPEESTEPPLAADAAQPPAPARSPQEPQSQPQPQQQSYERPTFDHASHAHQVAPLSRPEYVDNYDYYDDEGNHFPQRVVLRAGEWVDPDDPDLEPVRVYRWEAHQEGAGAVDQGQWTEDEGDARLDGEDYADENDMDSPDEGEDDEDDDTDEDDDDQDFEDRESPHRLLQTANPSFGVESPADAERLCGMEAIGATLISVGVSDDGEEVRLDFASPYFETYSSRTLGIDENGDPFIYSDLNAFEDDAPPGLGAKMFAAQVENAAKSGYAYIDNHAAGTIDNATFNGYYTWPLLGYNQTLESLRWNSPELVRKIEADFPDAKSILDVMDVPEVEDLPPERIAHVRKKAAQLDRRLGRPVRDRTIISGSDWWLVYGSDLNHARFDLSEGSRSRRRLAAYLEKKRRSS